MYNSNTDSRDPLQACRRKDKPAECKAEFPRTTWLIEQAAVLCKGLLNKLKMANGGRRNKLGSLHGPINHEYLNGTHPAMLAAQRFNSDVQLPYRFPITGSWTESVGVLRVLRVLRVLGVLGVLRVLRVLRVPRVLSL